MQLIIQLIGICGTVFAAFSFQANKHKRIMAWQAVTNGMFGLQYFLLHAMSGCVINIFSMLRSILFYFKEEHTWAAWKGWTYVSMAVAALIGVFTYDGWISLLPVAAVIINTVSFSFTSPKLVRATVLTASPLWMTYHIVNHSLGGILAESFVLVSVFVGMFRFDRRKKEAK